MVISRFIFTFDGYRDKRKRQPTHTPSPLSHYSNVLDETREDIKQGIHLRIWYLSSGFDSGAVCASLLFIGLVFWLSPYRMVLLWSLSAASPQGAFAWC